MVVARHKLFYLSVLAMIAVLAPAAMADAPATEQELLFFESRVRPILETACFKCHGAEPKIKGGLRLTSRAAILKGGDTGPAVSLEDPAKSLLLKAISYKDEDLQMPPKEQLPKEKIAILTRWVQAGIPWTPGAPEPVATSTTEAPI